MARVTSVASLGYAHYTLYEALPRLAAMGFERVEISSFDTYCFHFNYGSPNPSELKAMLDNLGLEAICLNYQASFHNAWVPEEIDQFVAEWTRKLEQLPEVGIPMLTMCFGIRNRRPDQEYQLANAVKAFDRVGKVASRYGVKMLLEVPHLYDIMMSPDSALRVLNRLTTDNVGVLIDSSHWGIIGYDIDGFISAVGNRLWHIHLRDSAGPDTSDFKQQLELTPGKGIVDFRKLAEALDRIGYAGDVSLEFEYRDMPFGAIDTEYREGMNYLQSCGWELPADVRNALKGTRFHAKDPPSGTK